MLVAVLGGLLGILMMIPLRRALIVKQHGMLKYPEGTACAEVLKAGATDEERAIAARGARLECAHAPRGRPPAPRPSSPASASASLYKAAMAAFKAWKDDPDEGLRAAVHGRLGLGRDLARAAGRRLHHRPAHRLDHVRRRRARLPGADPGHQVLRPGGGRRPRRPARCRSAEMGPDDIRDAYVLYIGAGAVAAGGIISLFRSLPTIWHGMKRRPRRLPARTGRRRGHGGGRAPHRAGPLAQVRGRRHRRPDRHDPAAPRSLHMNLLGRAADRRLRLPLRHRLVAPDRRDRLVVEPDLGHDGGDPAAHLPGLPGPRLDRLRPTTSPRCRSARSSASPPPTAAPPRRTSRPASWSAPRRSTQQIAILVGALASALVLGPILLA